MNGDLAFREHDELLSRVTETCRKTVRQDMIKINEELSSSASLPSPV